jgi:hypothetical protein
LGRIKILIDVMFVLGVRINVGLDESIFEALCNGFPEFEATKPPEGAFRRSGNAESTKWSEEG